MKRSEVDRSKLSPMMGHYLELKDKYEDTIIFYRLGDFYEMFFDDAVLVSHELELTLTGRSAGLDERVPMCGVPYHAKDMYIDRLIKKGYKVAICEQLEDPKSAKGVVKRDVVEIVSSGTVLSGNINEKENNYVGSVYECDYAYVFSYADITTGEIYTTLLDIDNNKILSEILANGLKEVIVNSKVASSFVDVLRYQYKIFTSVSDSYFDGKDYDYILEGITDVRCINGIRHLLYYLVNNSKRDLSHLQRVIYKKGNEYLKMDIHTIRNLELIESLRLKERNYSLLGLLDNTKTAMGSRKLRQFIENPLLDMDVLNKRYDTVEKLLNEFIMCDELREYLYEVYDLERLGGRIALGNCNGRDLLQLKNSLKVLPSIGKILKDIGFCNDMDVIYELYDLLDRSIYENPPVTLREGSLIKEGYNSELDELKDLRNGGKDFISKFEVSERQRTGIKNLKVGFNKVFGYYIEVSKSNIPLIKEEYGYIRKQTLSTGERYITNLLKEKEDIVLGAEEKIINLEYYLFDEIRKLCLNYVGRLQSVSKIISEIDVMQSFAKVSEKNGYVRPVLTSSHDVRVIDGRHPVVEKVTKDEYVPNDIVMDDKCNILLITGPNMAGKSTYMRQFGIIIIMAQIGCFVPAKEAVLPIFDKIFTRIGASDDLVSGESTFMVEMLEASNAIANATSNSLILFDELGRGTATYDGMSLAQAILEYIHDNIGCKTLFSTHYHELTDLANTLSNLKNKHVSASEENGDIVFLHKVMDGAVDKSYGINVAKLANLPKKVINRANEILAVYEASSGKREVKVQTSLPLDYMEHDSYVEEELKNVDILNTSPMEALNILYNLKSKVK